MAIISYIERIKCLDQLIRHRNTGNSSRLAQKLGISERMTYEYIAILKEMGAEITFSRSDDSYVYNDNIELEFGFKRVG